MPDPFRCSASSEADAEPLSATAPSDPDWFLLEHPGPWGRQAVEDSRLPDEVVAHLHGVAARVQLVRRPGGDVDGGARVFTAALNDADGRPVVRSAVLADVRDVLDLGEADLAPYDGPLWLVCTNGRRDVCCAERGRPVAAALAEVDAQATWETTHLGGHRFAGTLLALSSRLPSALALGRLDIDSAVGAVADIAAGRVPLDVTRGRAGWTPATQYADLHLRREHGWTGLDDVRPAAGGGGGGDVVILETPGGPVRVVVRDEAGRSRRQSCADDATKATRILSVDSVTMVR